MAGRAGGVLAEQEALPSSMRFSPTSPGCDLSDALCFLTPMLQELCRVFRGAWRAHGFGEHVDSEDGQGSIWLEEVISRLMAKELGGRGGKVLSMRSALPSHSFVRVSELWELQRPMVSYVLGPWVRASDFFPWAAET